MKTNYKQQARELVGQCATEVLEAMNFDTSLNSVKCEDIPRLTEIILYELNLVALLEDKARLDWLEKYPFSRFRRAIDNETESGNFRIAITQTMKEDEK